MDLEGSVLMQKFELGKLLGKGTFAKVYHARNIKTGISVAIKVIDKRKISRAGMMDQIKREISVMKLVRHPNVVQLYEVMGSKAKIYMVMEYVRGGELFNKVAKGKLREGAARKYFQQLISGVDFCHSRGVYHRDLKPENILVDENGNLKISDFGLSALAESKRLDGLLHTTCGTPAYVAPEIISKKGYDGAKSDIWSCGVILFVLLAGNLPFHGSNLMEMYRKIKEGKFLYPNWISSDVRELISKILDPEASTRISMSKIMRNSWFRKGVQLKAAGGNGAAVVADGGGEVVKPAMLNAFDIISLSAGFDLSGLFDDNNNSWREKEHKFTSNQSAKAIVSKLEEVAKRLKLKETKKGGGLVRFEKSKAGRKGPLSIDAEIFEVGPSFHVVEMKKCSGDTLEYHRLMKRDIRPSLNDIVWTWQGDDEPRPWQQPENKLALQSSN